MLRLSVVGWLWDLGVDIVLSVMFARQLKVHGTSDGRDTKEIGSCPSHLS
jgi:hypothetical protein